MADYGYTSEELDKLSLIKEYLSEQNSNQSNIITQDFDIDMNDGRYSNVTSLSNNMNIIPLLLMFDLSDIRLRSVSYGSVPGAVKKLLQDELPTAHVLQQALDGVIDWGVINSYREAQGDTYIIKIHSIYDYYKQKDMREVYSKLNNIDSTYSLASTVLIEDTHHSVWLHVDKAKRIVHVLTSKNKSTTHMEVLTRRLVSLIPTLFDINLDDTLVNPNELISLISLQKDKRMYSFNYTMDQYLNDALKWKENAKYTALLEITSFDKTKTLEAIESKKRTVRSRESDIIALYEQIRRMQMEIAYYNNGMLESKIDELVNYIKEYKPQSLVKARKISSTKAELTLKAPMVFTDPNVFTPIYERGTDGLRKDTALGQLYYHAVITDRVVIHMRAKITVNFKTGDVAAHQLTTSAKSDAMVNPHLSAASCFGTNRNTIVQAANANNYIALYEQLLGAVGSINFADGAVRPYVITYSENCPGSYIEIKETGERITLNQWKEIYNDF